MNVLIATQDTVFCRMLTLEFSEKGFSINRVVAHAPKENPAELPKIEMPAADPAEDTDN